MNDWKYSANKEGMREMQGLVSQDALRDWLRHLQSEVEQASDERVDSVDRANGKPTD